MIIYLLERTSNDDGFEYQYSLTSNDYSYKKLDEFDRIDPYSKKSLKDNWKPISIEFYKKTYKGLKHIHPPDYDTMLLIPLFSEKAILKLEELLLKSGEILETINVDKKNKQKYFIFNGLKIIDCFDLERAEKRLNMFNHPIEIYKYEFIEEKINKDLDIFQVPFVSRKYFVTQRFVDIVIENDLKGFTFVPVWSSDGNLGDVIQT